MILIIGGSYQGKLSWAVNEYDLKPDELCDLKSGFIPERKCYYHLEDYVKSTDSLPDFSDSIVIAREIGCGIVPMDKNERAFREHYGKCLQELAKNSDKVIRIFCGLPQVINDFHTT